jgi:hypothetical protein
MHIRNSPEESINAKTFPQKQCLKNGQVISFDYVEMPASF